MDLTVKRVILTFNMEPLQDSDLGGCELLYNPGMSIWMYRKRTACLYSLTGHNLKQDTIVASSVKMGIISLTSEKWVFKKMSIRWCLLEYNYEQLSPLGIFLKILFPLSLLKSKSYHHKNTNVISPSFTTNNAIYI